MSTFGTAGTRPSMRPAGQHEATLEGRVKIGLGSLDDCAVVVLVNAAGTGAVCQERFRAAIEEESRILP